MAMPLTPVKLVDYEFSSDEEQENKSAMDAGMQSESEWSSFGEIPSDSSDSFSYRMRSPESERNDDDVDVDVDDDDGDEDYRPPSRASSSSLESYMSMPSSPAASASSISTNGLETGSVQSFEEEDRAQAAAFSASSSGQQDAAFSFGFAATEGRVQQDSKPKPSLFHGFSASSSGMEGAAWTAATVGERGSSQSAENVSTAAFGGSKSNTEAWSGLRAAFESNPFKRHNATATGSTAAFSSAANPTGLLRDVELEKTAQAKPSVHAENPFDRVQGRWSSSHASTSSTSFGFDSRGSETIKTADSAASGSTTSHWERSQCRSTSRESAVGSSTMDSTMADENRPTASSFPSSADSTSGSMAPKLSFPTSSEAPKFSFVSVDKPASRPSSKGPLSAKKVPTFSFGASTSASTSGFGQTDDAEMRSPARPASAPARRGSATGGFSFGTEFNSSEAFDFMAGGDGGANFGFSTPDSTAGQARGERNATAASSSSSFQFSRAATNSGAGGTFAPGVAGPARQQRPRGVSGRRRKLNGSSAAQASASHSDPSTRRMPPPAPLFGPSFRSPPFQTTYTSRPGASDDPPVEEAMDDDAAGSSAETFGVKATENDMEQPVNGFVASEEPMMGPKSSKTAPFSFGSADTASSAATRPTPLRTSAFGFRDTSSGAINPELGANAQLPKQQSQPQTSSTARRFSGPPVDNLKSTFGDFRIGSSGMGTPQRRSRTRRRNGGIFTNKNSPKRGSASKTHEPEPSPGGPSASSGASASPFGFGEGPPAFSYRNPRHRRTFSRSPPADPFVTPIFQTRQPSVSSDSTEGGHPRPKLARPSAKKGVHLGFGAGSGATRENARAPTGQAKSASGFGFLSGATQSQTPGSIFAQTAASSSLADGASRRILRAARPKARAPGMESRSGCSGVKSSEQDEGDADMESDEDDADWAELKQQGDQAHSEQRFAAAAELYRESIDALESLLDRDVAVTTRGVLEDKAKLHANRAASLMMLMQIAEAQRECQRSIEANPAYTRAYLRLGRIQVLLGDTSQAQSNVETAKGLLATGAPTSTRNNEADRLSIRKMEATIEKLSVLQGEIRWCTSVGDTRQALPLVEKALVLAPSSRTLQVQKARVLLEQKKYDAMVTFCGEIVQKQRAILAMSPPAAEESDLDACEAARAQAAEEIAFVGIELGLLWATTLHYQNKVEEAVRTLSALETVAPCSAEVIRLKRQWKDVEQLKQSGNECFKRSEFRKALQLYSQALQVDEQHDEYCAILFCNRAAAQMGLERYHTALQDCGEALHRKPAYPRALLRRARCYVALNKPQEAVLDFDRYLQAQSRSASSESVAEVRRERNEAKAAIAKAREETRRREAAKRKAEREQRQRHAQDWEKAWEDNKFYENFRRTWGSGGRSKASGGQERPSSGRASFMESRSAPKRTHYDVLGVHKAAASGEIKKAYRKLALVYHPDKLKTAGHADVFKEMTAAYNVLSDASARAKYDREQLYSRFGNYYES